MRFLLRHRAFDSVSNTQHDMFIPPRTHNLQGNRETFVVIANWKSHTRYACEIADSHVPEINNVSSIKAGIESAGWLMNVYQRAFYWTKKVLRTKHKTTGIFVALLPGSNLSAP